MRLGCARLLREQSPDRDRRRTTAASPRGRSSRTSTATTSRTTATTRPGRPSTGARSAGRPTSASAGGRSPASSRRATRARATRSTPARRFAEDYRLLNERRLGLPEIAVGASSTTASTPTRPRSTCCALDVTSPWTGNTSATLRGVRSRLGRRAAASRSATPLDGSFSVTLTSPRAARLTLRLVDPATHQVLASSTGTARVKSLAAEVCGQRTLQVQVKRVAPAPSRSRSPGRREQSRHDREVVDEGGRRRGVPGPPIPWLGRAPWPSG